jgi:hypothetical protein
MTLRSILGVSLALAILGSLTSCTERRADGTGDAAPPPATQSTPAADRSAAQPASDLFVNALIARDANAMLPATALPFSVRTQEWALVEDVEGGADRKPPVDREATTREALQPLLAEIAAHVAVERPDATPPPREILFSEYLSGIEPLWADLDVRVYLGPSADVIHHVLVGVDRKTGQVRALYAN